MDLNSIINAWNIKMTLDIKYSPFSLQTPESPFLNKTQKYQFFYKVLFRFKKSHRTITKNRMAKT